MDAYANDPIQMAPGACVQIFLFSVAAIELKRKAPGAHTMLEGISFPISSLCDDEQYLIRLRSTMTTNHVKTS